MANPDRSIDPKLLQAAKKEFLNEGFLKASIRKICADAGVTTGAFYKRYKTKDELFDALVGPTLDEFLQTVTSIEPDELRGIEESGSMDVVWSNPSDSLDWIMNYMYDHYDEFRLILTCAAGTRYDDFPHEITKLACQGTMRVMGLAYEKGLATYMPEEDELHMLITAYFASAVEPIKHGFTREKAMKYCKSLQRLFDWQGLFGC